MPSFSEQVETIAKVAVAGSIPLGAAVEQILQETARMIAKGTLPAPSDLAQKAIEWKNLLTVSSIRLSTELYTVALTETFVDAKGEPI